MIVKGQYVNNNKINSIMSLRFEPLKNTSVMDVETPLIFSFEIMHVGVNKYCHFTIVHPHTRRPTHHQYHTRSPR